MCEPATETFTDCGAGLLCVLWLPEADGLGSSLDSVRLGAAELAPGPRLPPEPSVPPPPSERFSSAYVTWASASASTTSPRTSTARARRSRPPGEVGADRAAVAAAGPGPGPGVGPGVGIGGVGRTGSGRAATVGAYAPAGTVSA
ncbi:hypothetical protein ACWGIV_29300, partial [Streptomyces sp. NPDC054844]